MPIIGAMAIAGAVTLLVIGGLVFGLRRMERAAGIWKARNARAQIGEPPWYVRFFDWLNQ
jgi:MprA protease rhombosortase-interaction domain-containing protein